MPRRPTVVIRVGDDVIIIKGKNRGAKGTVKNIYADGLFRIKAKGKKPIYAWSRQLEKPISRICDYCGCSFQPSRNDSRMRFCSSECRCKNNNKMKSIGGRDYWTPINGISSKECPVCSRIFYHNRRKYCSDSCSYEADSHQYQKGKTAQGFIALRCPECTLLFVTNKIIKKFCSKECYIKYHKHHLIIKKTEVCKHIYNSKDDPDSISNLIEDWTGISCDRKIRDEKEDHRTESPDRGPREISSTKKIREGWGCVICGFAKDKRGKYCKDCWRAMGRKYDTRAIKTLGKVDITVEQKRKCASCRILPKCIEANNVHDGCNIIFKSLQGREVKKKIRSLRKMVTGDDQQ